MKPIRARLARSNVKDAKVSDPANRHSLRGLLFFAHVTSALVCFTLPLSAADFETGERALRAGDAETALNIWVPLARNGHARSQAAIGALYEYGRGVPRDDVEAAEWYEKAAVQNLSEAQYRLGVFYENGWGVTQDATLAAKWYERAAKLDHPFAQHDLAFMYFEGDGVPKDGIQAYKWLKIAATRRADVMQKHLLYVSKTLTAGEIAEAEALAHAWLNAEKL